MLSSILESFESLDYKDKEIINNSINKIINPIKIYLFILLFVLILICVNNYYINLNIVKLIKLN
jgi:hypothetical protein